MISNFGMTHHANDRIMFISITILTAWEKFGSMRKQLKVLDKCAPGQNKQKSKKEPGITSQYVMISDRTLILNVSPTIFDVAKGSMQCTISHNFH